MEHGVDPSPAQRGVQQRAVDHVPVDDVAVALDPLERKHARRPHGASQDRDPRTPLQQGLRKPSTDESIRPGHENRATGERSPVALPGGLPLHPARDPRRPRLGSNP